MKSNLSRSIQFIRTKQCLLPERYPSKYILLLIQSSCCCTYGLYGYMAHGQQNAHSENESARSTWLVPHAVVAKSGV